MHNALCPCVQIRHDTAITPCAKWTCARGCNEGNVACGEERLFKGMKREVFKEMSRVECGEERMM